MSIIYNYIGIGQERKSVSNSIYRKKNKFCCYSKTDLNLILKEHMKYYAYCNDGCFNCGYPF